MLLKHVRILDAIAQTERFDNVFITNGKVVEIGGGEQNLPSNTPVQDATGLILGKGLVDLYSSSGEPGFEHRETLDSLSKAASSGGFSKLAILPNTKPVLDNIAALEFIRAQPHTTFLPWGAITKGCEGKQINDLAELSSSVVGFTDAKPMTNLNLLRSVMEYIKPLGKPLMLWAWDPNLSGEGVMREGKWSIQYGLSGSPAIAETSALAALIELVKLTHTPTHFMRISTRRSVELIAAAKAAGLPITASVPWMNLWLIDQDLATYDPNLRLAPPLGVVEDREALVSGIKSQVIDAIAIDHTPYTYEEKTVAFEVSPPGSIGLEFALPILWQQLVVTQKLTSLELWRALSDNPARCLQIEPPELVTLFDPSQIWTVTQDAIASHSYNTPCYKQSITGKVLSLSEFG